MMVKPRRRIFLSPFTAARRRHLGTGLPLADALRRSIGCPRRARNTTKVLRRCSTYGIRLGYRPPLLLVRTPFVRSPRLPGGALRTESGIARTDKCLRLRGAELYNDATAIVQPKTAGMGIGA